MQSEHRIVRFVLAERLAHWVYAVCFLAAATTGLLMFIPRTRIWLDGSRESVIRYHGVIGLVMVLAPLALFLILGRRRLAMDIRQIDLWDEEDTEWFWRAVRGGTLRHAPMPPQGRFNAGQKMNAIIVSAMTVGFVVTGSLLLAKQHVSPGLHSSALALHIVIAFAAIALFLGHLAHALVTRHGRDSLRAMVDGTMGETTGREHYPKWWSEQGPQG